MPQNPNDGGYSEKPTTCSGVTVEYSLQFCSLGIAGKLHLHHTLISRDWICRGAWASSCTELLPKTA